MTPTVLARVFLAGLSVVSGSLAGRWSVQGDSCLLSQRRRTRLITFLTGQNVESSSAVTVVYMGSNTFVFEDK